MERTHQRNAGDEIRRRQALTWNPQGRRKRGRPGNTWGRDLETDTKMTGYTWKQIDIKPRSEDWKNEVNGFCPRRDDGQNGCDVSCL